MVPKVDHFKKKKKKSIVAKEVESKWLKKKSDNLMHILPLSKHETLYFRLVLNLPSRTLCH